MKYNHFTMLPERAFRAVGGRIMPQGGSSGGSASTPTQTTVTNTNISPYAQPYVESTLGQAQALTDINQNPYQAYQGQQVAGFSPMQVQAFQGIAGQQVAPQIQQATDLANQVGQRGLAAYGTAGQLQGTALDYGRQASGLAPQDIAMGNAGAQAGFSYGQNATNPGAVQQYMNPYIKATLDPALKILNQQYDMQNAGQQGAATSAGAFGGSREALMESLNNQNRSLAQNQLVGNTFNQAYDTANRNMQQASSLGIQGAQTGIAGLDAANRTYGTALQGVSAATGAGQYGLQGLGAAGQAASTLGALGQTQYQQETGINQNMLAAGNQQQANQQQGLSTDYQNYLDNLNYPYKQLGFMQGIYSGLPMSQTASSMYQNTGALLPQLAGAGLSAYGISQKSGTGQKEGGLTKSYAVGGAVAVDPQVPQSMSPNALQPLLERLTPQQLQAYAANVKDVVTLGAIRATLQRKMAAQQQPATPPTSTVAQDMMQSGGMGGLGGMGMGGQQPQPAMAGGGIIGMAVGGPTVPVKNEYGFMSLPEYRDQIAQDSAVSAEDQAAAAKMQQYRDQQEAEAKRLQGNTKWDAVIGLGKGLMQGRSLTDAIAKGGASGVEAYTAADATAEAAQQKAREAQIAQQQYETALRKGDKQLAAQILEKYQTAAAQHEHANLQYKGQLAHVGAVNGQTLALREQGLLSRDDAIVDAALKNDPRIKAFTASLSMLETRAGAGDPTAQNELTLKMLELGALRTRIRNELIGERSMRRPGAGGKTTPSAGADSGATARPGLDSYYTK